MHEQLLRVLYCTRNPWAEHTSLYNKITIDLPLSVICNQATLRIVCPISSEKCSPFSPKEGSVKSDECSTGKGHCCFDATAGTAAGGACSEARSVQKDNNCTPVGDFIVTTKIPKTGGGIEFWTQFHDLKQVALHKYSPVDGTPLSPGCVRLHEGTSYKEG